MAALIILLFDHGPWGVAQAQFLPSLQANEPEEFDSYLEVLHATDLRARLAAADRFEAAWPKSELLAHIYELRFEAQRERGNTAAAVGEGRRALKAAPSNLTVAVRLASVLANIGRLDEAERLVARANDVLANFRVPRTVPFPEWQARSRWIRARAAAALGLIAFKRDQTNEAIARFEEAVILSPEPADHLRLGRLYRLAGRENDASRQFELAAASGDEAVRKLVDAELRSQRQ